MNTKAAANYYLEALMSTILTGSNLGRLVSVTTDKVEACESPSDVLDAFEAHDYSATHGKAAKPATALAAYHVRREIDIRNAERG